MKQQSKKRLCVFQLHHTDRIPTEEKFNPVIKLNRSEIFDHIVLAVPDIDENRFLQEYARQWGVEIFFGSIDNITQRLYNVAQMYDCPLIARPSIHWFYLDPDLIKNMLDVLEKTDAEMLLLPRNFDVTFGADVFNIQFLENMLTLFRHNAQLRAQFMHHPWGYLDLYPEKGNVVWFTDIPKYNRQQFDSLVTSLKQNFPEAGVTADKTYPYRHILQNLQGHENILDIACGAGSGTALIATQAAHVTGVDINHDLVQQAGKHYASLPNVRFLPGNIFDLVFKPKEFDTIISIHTMEHVEDDRRFIALLHQWLKDRGELYLEVPLLMEYPFKGIPIPMNPYHAREYSLSGLEDLLKPYFDYVNTWAVVREWYTDIEHKRNSVMIYASKSGGATSWQTM